MMRKPHCFIVSLAILTALSGCRSGQKVSSLPGMGWLDNSKSNATNLDPTENYPPPSAAESPVSMSAFGAPGQQAVSNPSISSATPATPGQGMTAQNLPAYPGTWPNSAGQPGTAPPTSPGFDTPPYGNLAQNVSSDGVQQGPYSASAVGSTANSYPSPNPPAATASPYAGPPQVAADYASSYGAAAAQGSYDTSTYPTTSAGNANALVASRNSQFPVPAGGEPSTGTSGTGYQPAAYTNAETAGGLGAAAMIPAASGAASNNVAADYAQSPYAQPPYGTSSANAAGAGFMPANVSGGDAGYGSPSVYDTPRTAAAWHPGSTSEF